MEIELGKNSKKIVEITIMTRPPIYIRDLPPSKLRIHMRIHTNEKAIGSPQCGGSFSSRAKVRRHVWIEHVQHTTMSIGIAQLTKLSVTVCITGSMYSLQYVQTTICTTYSIYHLQHVQPKMYSLKKTQPKGCITYLILRPTTTSLLPVRRNQTSCSLVQNAAKYSSPNEC